VNTLFIRDPELALVAWVGGYLVAAWLQETLPLVRWTPEHAAMANVRPSKILRVVIGGVLGIAVGPAIGYAFNLQHYVVPLVAAPLILVPLAFYCIPNHRTFLLLTVSVIVGIGGLVLLGKYQEQRFIAKTIEGLKPKLLTPTLE